MPISTLTFQTNALAEMEALETAMTQTQTELSTGSRLPNAAADPAATEQVNQLNMTLAASQQYVSNGTAATANLQLEQSALTSATNALQSARDLAVEANNGALSATDRQDIATQLQQLKNALLGAANSTDPAGNYLFAGTASGTQPFAQTGSSVSYQGDSQVNQVQIAADQSVSAGDSGSSVFMNIPAGNGTFTTAAAAANTGSASIDPGSVTNPAAWVPDTYTITFTSPTQYQVTDSAGNVVVPATTYTSGQAITFNGIETTVSGTPSAGDQFTVAPAGQASIFSTIGNLISALNSGTLTSAQVTTQIGTAVTQMDNALNNFDDVQASVGGRLNAITAAGNGAQSTQTQLQGTISTLSDTDYAAATTQLSTEELALQAAQESYASIAKLSLFNYVN
ncbi:MAG TPA: flagellar hook-associated protein FlgL [Steroidobacteraceae bacterium]|jgi:flagellar hook-associated protein 3 FlgL|nr:flagellar hook-associated protein FlgL [Steroidobacteraceae bacterium]